MSEPRARDCGIGPGERVGIEDTRLRDCELAAGTRLVLRYEDAPTRRKEPSTMRPTGPAPTALPDSIDGEAAPLAASMAGPLTATVGAPSTGAGELAQLVPAGGRVDGLTVVLGLVAVLGGGAAWRFYRQWSRERHELALRELELRAAGGAGPECAAAAALRVDVQQLEARLVELEARQAELPRTATPTARMGRLESSGKVPAKRKTTGGK